MQLLLIQVIISLNCNKEVHDEVQFIIYHKFNLFIHLRYNLVQKA
jgi:hypothetical protein